MQGLLEAREDLQPLLSQSNDRLKDLLFLDLALDSTVRTVIERGYEELNDAGPEVSNSIYFHSISLCIKVRCNTIVVSLCRKLCTS